MRIIPGDKCDERKFYVLASEAEPVEKDLTKLRTELASKNNFLACCDIIARMPYIVQHIVQQTDHLEEKRISKMSGVWDTGVVRRQDYRVVLWHVKGECADCTDPSLRQAVADACAKLKIPFPEELE